MLTGTVIIAFSLALLVYWFRYSCILILRNRAEEQQPSRVVDGAFNFAQARQSIGSEDKLDPLWESLDRDYRVLTYLIEHAAALKLATLEDRILILDYRIMQRVYRMTRTLAPSQARNALVEMSTVLGILMQRLGEQAGTPSEA